MEERDAMSRFDSMDDDHHAHGWQIDYDKMNDQSQSVWLSLCNCTAHPYHRNTWPSTMNLLERLDLEVGLSERNCASSSGFPHSCTQY
jgi:hypothetical protein